MLLSKSCIYAIRALLLVASKSTGEGYISTRKVADELGISFHFLAKITQILTDAKLIRSYRGPNGGIGIARSTSEIYLIDIIEATDGTSVFDKCLLGLPSCSAKDPCPLHDSWSESKDHLLGEFRTRSIADIISGSDQLRLKG